MDPELGIQLPFTLGRRHWRRPAPRIPRYNPEPILPATPKRPGPSHDSLSTIRSDHETTRRCVYHDGDDKRHICTEDDAARREPEEAGHYAAGAPDAGCKLRDLGARR